MKGGDERTAAALLAASFSKKQVSRKL